MEDKITIVNRLRNGIHNLKSGMKPKKGSCHYETIILHEYQAIYFAIPKVGSSTWHRICAILLNVDIPPIAIQKERRVENLPGINKKELVKYKNYFKFCFVRNPWDRLVSCYGNKIKTDPSLNSIGITNGIASGFLRFGVFKAGMSFDEFVRAVVNIPDVDADPHFKSQYTFIAKETGEKLVDFIGKLENAEEDFLYVLNRLNRTDILIPHFKKNSNKKHYREYYTPDVRDMVSKRYSKDIQMFGYDF